jgi:hypothetical protein
MLEAAIGICGPQPSAIAAHDGHFVFLHQHSSDFFLKLFAVLPCIL